MVLVERRPIPLILRPEPGRRRASLERYLETERRRLGELLLRHGALLFRGFGSIDSPELARAIAATGETPMRYVGGISPRTSLTDGIYTSTELSGTAHIPLHSELSYLSAHPRHLWFACVEAAARGGETVLADARRIYRRIDARVRERFVELGVAYTCSFRGDSLIYELLERVQKLTKSWRDALETDDPEEAAERCREVGAEPHWLPSGRLVMETRRPATVRHPDTGETVWFNSAHLFRLNRRYIGWLHFRLAQLLALDPRARTHHARYGDGSEIESESIEHLFDVMEAETVPVPWQAGDVLWVDNLLCMHGRNPFRGERRVLAAMTK